MKKRAEYIDVNIDRLTNSIENAVTGEVFETEINEVTKTDVKKIRKTDWQFDWNTEISDQSKTVYKLTTVNNPNIIQGLLSIEDKGDHVFMHLLESANFNIGKLKMYFGVPANLVAWACKVSFEKGYAGYVAFDSKSQLIEHYKETLGATHFRGLRMYIETRQAGVLVSRYFKN